MKVVIQETYEDVNEWAAKFICKRINEHNCSPNNYFVLGLPTGNIILVNFMLNILTVS